MKRRILCGMLAFLCFCLPACSNAQISETAETSETTEEMKSSTEEKPQYPLVANPLTWEKINAIPYADDSMTSDELRQICVDFMRLQLTFEWTPLKTIQYSLSTKKSMAFYSGNVYGGLPYRSFDANGNIYTVMEFYDPETGVLDPGKRLGNDFAGIIGNDCASSPFWAWCRVINSNRNFADFELENGVTNIGLTPENNLLPVGGYTSISEGTWDDGDGTKAVCERNGEQAMFRAYAAILPADGLVQFYPKTGGVLSNANHLMMASAKATVAYREDGTIDGEKSYITILDQRSNLTYQKKPDVSDFYGVYYEGGIDAVFTFQELLRQYYIPFTFLEFLDLDPVEKAEANLICQGDPFKFQDLKTASVSANYAISHAKITFTDETGKECYSYIVRPKILNTREISLDTLILSNSSFHADGKKTCSISVRLGSGHEICVFEGVVGK